MRAPVSHPHPFLGLGLPVLDEPAIGDLGLLGELALVLPARSLTRGPECFPRREARPDQLERAQLAAGERGPPEGVVLFAVSRCQNSTQSLRAVATSAICAPRLARTRS